MLFAAKPPEPKKQPEPKQELEVIVELEEVAKVRAWRREVLEGEGFGACGDVIADDLGVDLHQAVNLRRAGCSPEMVAQLLL
jgi:hypothetical protein